MRQVTRLWRDGRASSGSRLRVQDGPPVLGGLQWPYIRVNRRENCSYVFFLFASTARELYVEEDRIPKIIQCRMCHLQFPGEKCSRGRGVCTAAPEESCTTGRIFRNDGTPWLTFRGCLENCANVDNIKWSIYLVNFRCCRSHDLCNENL
ncbi:prostate and testis expressed protein 1 [Camelus ferus]|uniref:Prostate and testis expressed protein 1 n=1 Tax=Camelus ferus TaxID=419612 RepID=A0A8B8SFT0_CAMFR|nr:prostate and testis expressed protein 1 [Camelus ferus]